MSRMEILTEYSIPHLLLWNQDATLTLIVMCLAIAFSRYIVFNCPAGMPTE